MSVGDQLGLDDNSELLDQARQSPDPRSQGLSSKISKKHLARNKNLGSCVLMPRTTDKDKDLEFEIIKRDYDAVVAAIEKNEPVLVSDFTDKKNKYRKALNRKKSRDHQRNMAAAYAASKLPTTLGTTNS